MEPQAGRRCGLGGFDGRLSAAAAAGGSFEFFFAAVRINGIPSQDFRFQSAAFQIATDYSENVFFPLSPTLPLLSSPSVCLSLFLSLPLPLSCPPPRCSLQRLTSELGFVTASNKWLFFFFVKAIAKHGLPALGFHLCLRGEFIE